ncbi:uncharacterized protein LOC143336274 [Chaetodon auriga]|uniref:uncharacterized protein LOC143336274 n=1 Tax=Chaetodon auriga TaxID=39042 RepID=UPI004032A915
MSALRWTHVSLLLMLLHVTGVPGQHPSFTVREGDDVTLHCDAMQYQVECDQTSWFLSGSSGMSVELIRPGRTAARSPADRVGLTENCSLFIKNVTAEDGGVYTCVQFIRVTRNSQVGLFVMTMTEQKNAVFTRLSCSVSQLGRCDHTVKWLFRGTYVEGDVEVSQPRCSEAVVFAGDYLKQVDGEPLRCEVTHRHTGAVQRFDFSPQSSGDKSDEAATTARSTPEATTTTPTTTPTTTTTTTAQARADCSAVNYIMLVMRVAELVLVTVITVLLIRARGRQRPADDHTELHGGGRHGGTVKYENVGDLTASVKLDNLHTNISSAQK